MENEINANSAFNLVGVEVEVEAELDKTPDQLLSKLIVFPLCPQD